MKKEHVPFAVSRILDGRPVRWAPPSKTVGDYDGRDRTLQVFNAQPREQRDLLRRIDQHRAALEKAAGGPLIVLFHSSRQSQERYRDFLDAFPRPVADRAVAPIPPSGVLDTADESGPHRIVAA